MVFARDLHLELTLSKGDLDFLSWLHRERVG